MRPLPVAGVVVLRDDERFSETTPMDSFASFVQSNVPRAYTTDQSNEFPFILDSGASKHMITGLEWLKDLRSIAPRRFVLQKGCSQEVLLVPQLQYNLLSCSTLRRNEYRINFAADKCTGIVDGIIRFQGIRVDGVYQMHGHPIHSLGAAANVAKYDRTDGKLDSRMTLWHHRLGHAHLESFKRLPLSGAVTGISFKPVAKTRTSCSSCIKGKQTRQTLPVNKSRSVRNGSVIHTDVCGPVSVQSFSGARYFVCG